MEQVANELCMEDGQGSYWITRTFYFVCLRSNVNINNYTIYGVDLTINVNMLSTVHVQYGPRHLSPGIDATGSKPAEPPEISKHNLCRIHYYSSLVTAGSRSC